MSGIYEWIRGLVSFLILLTVVTNLLPQKAYEKYFRLFAGALFLLMLLRPFLDITGLEGQVVSAFRQITFQNEADMLKREIEDADGKRMQRLHEQYRQNIETELQAMALDCSLECIETSIVIGTDAEYGLPGRIEAVYLTVRAERYRLSNRDTRNAEYRNANQNIEELKNKIGEYYGVEIRNIAVNLKDE